MKYLILGSAGQIGAHLVKHLKDAGHSVLGYDIEENKHDDLRYYSAELLGLMYWSDFVFFLAFDVGGANYLRQYQFTYDFLSNNIKLMDNAFALLKKTGRPFIFASSQMSNMGHSSYGILKAIGERYTDSLNGLTVRFWNVYGIERNSDVSKFHVITDFILKAMSGKITVMTDGTEVRQFLYADDCCEALELLSNLETYDSTKTKAASTSPASSGSRYTASQIPLANL